MQKKPRELTEDEIKAYFVRGRSSLRQSQHDGPKLIQVREKLSAEVQLRQKVEIEAAKARLSAKQALEQQANEIEALRAELAQVKARNSQLETVQRQQKDAIVSAVLAMLMLVSDDGDSSPPAAPAQSQPVDADFVPYALLPAPAQGRERKLSPQFEAIRQTWNTRVFDVGRRAYEEAI